MRELKIVYKIADIVSQYDPAQPTPDCAASHSY